MSDTLAAFLTPYASHFCRLGWTVDCASAVAECQREQLQPFSTVHDIPWSRNPFRGDRVVRGALGVRKLVAENGYDIVHVHTPVAAFLARVALRALRPRYQGRLIYTAHGFHFHPRGSYLVNSTWATCERLAGRYTDWLVVINEADYQVARALSLVPNDRLVQMPGIGVDLTAYSASTVSGKELQNVRHELRLRDSDVLFLCVAEFIRRKRHADVVKALSSLRRPDIHIGFAGTGPTLPEIQSLAIRLGVPGQAHFLGFRNDIARFILASRATILASSREGLPRACLESFCAGVPVIGSRIRGIVDVVTPECGLLFDLGDEQSLAMALESLADNPQLASQLGANGKERVKQFGIERLLSQHEDLYERALRGSVRLY